MALDYMVAVATARSVSEIAALVNTIRASGEISDQATADRLIEGIAVERGLYIRVGAARSPDWGDPVAEQFGFKPTVSVFFRLNKTESLDAQVDDILFIATALLSATSDDMIVYFLESGDVWAIRRAGSLELNSAAFMWTPERTEMVRQSHAPMSYAL
ncbi:SitI3 family protein [Nocardia asteroides]|uniref:SitI3 family protein n=1 Tax=Nocardia asteroides TaxID=1824 RepID=UPI00340BCA5B